MADSRMFIKVHNGLPEHPKTADLSDRAFRNLIELWCYCSRNLTDGIVKRSQANRIVSVKSLRELVAAGFVVEREGELEMHDYLDHQMSRDEVTDLRERRVAAGRKGGLAKANNLASAKGDATEGLEQTPSKPLADVDKYLDVDKKEIARKRATQLSDDFQPTEHHHALAAEHRINLTHELAKFRDYYRATGKTMKDWDATFNNWIRNARGAVVALPGQQHTGDDNAWMRRTKKPDDAG